ncbi:unnamed protein product [Linum tenue]|uniref:Uncharacterized protein n=1 Tax=Linum tenue TaxID=586396 RepID=A0AAV0IYJ4_9ROSI|nr:unnamed protein product [Linum tenue]
MSIPLPHRFPRPRLHTRRRPILHNSPPREIGTPPQGKADPPEVLLPRHRQRPQPHRRPRGTRRHDQHLPLAFRACQHDGRPPDRGPQIELQACGPGPGDLRLGLPDRAQLPDGAQLRIYGRQVQRQQSQRVGPEQCFLRGQGDACRRWKRGLPVRPRVRSGEDSRVRSEDRRRGGGV